MAVVSCNYSTGLLSSTGRVSKLAFILASKAYTS